MKTFIQDGHTLVLRAVRKLSGAETGWAVPGKGLRLVVEEVQSRDWASATFAGQLHRFELRLEGAAAEVEAAVARVEMGLPEVDSACGRYFIAEAGLVDVTVQTHGGEAIASLSIDALTLEA